MNQDEYNKLDDQAHRVAYLIAGYIRNTLTSEEHTDLDDWVTASDENMKLFEDLTDEKNIEANLQWMDKVNSEAEFKRLQDSGAFKQKAKRFRFHPSWIAAASLIVIAGASYFIYRSSNGNTTKIMTSLDSSSFKPGGNKAYLMIGGSIIDLTQTKNGLMLNNNGSDIIKLGEGALLYEPDSNKKIATVTHTLTTPVGGQFQVKLGDGTTVWLNSMTSLKYPSRFDDKERRVSINGEAYFEVAKNEKQPFKVILRDSSEVTVLGTHFNIMSYPDEMGKEITLLEGSIIVSKNNADTRLVPGMQAIINGNDVSTKTGIDTEEVIGWKNELFVFHDAPIESVMRQIERWYDAKIVYQDEVKDLFNAAIKRSEPLSKLLHLLELNGHVHFKTENKTIYVLQ
jgi:transmembrane sensor